MKPLCTLSLILCLLFACCGTTLASNNGVLSSSTILSCSASLQKGSSKGKLSLNYTIRGNATMSTIGVSSIKLYTSSGSYVTTITGTTSNGLLAKNSLSQKNSYTCSVTSGTSYYAVVTFVATGGGLSDSKQIKTNTVTAP